MRIFNAQAPPRRGRLGANPASNLIGISAAVVGMVLVALVWSHGAVGGSGVETTGSQHTKKTPAAANDVDWGQGGQEYKPASTRKKPRIMTTAVPEGDEEVVEGNNNNNNNNPPLKIRNSQVRVDTENVKPIGGNNKRGEEVKENQQGKVLGNNNNADNDIPQPPDLGDPKKPRHLQEKVALLLPTKKKVTTDAPAVEVDQEEDAITTTTKAASTVKNLATANPTTTAAVEPATTPMPSSAPPQLDSEEHAKKKKRNQPAQVVDEKISSQVPLINSLRMLAESYGGTWFYLAQGPLNRSALGTNNYVKVETNELVEGREEEEHQSPHNSPGGGDGGGGQSLLWKSEFLLESTVEIGENQADVVEDLGIQGGKGACSRNWDCDVGKGCMSTSEGVCYERGAQAPSLTAALGIETQTQHKQDVKKGGGKSKLLDQGAAVAEKEEQKRKERLHEEMIQRSTAQREKDLRQGQKPKIEDGMKKPTGGSATEELVCTWADDPKPLPSMPHNFTGNYDSSAVVQAFKSLTGKEFQKWYDWDAPITEVQENDEFRMSTKVEGEHRVLKLNNFCVRPGGSLMGWKKADVAVFQAGDDVRSEVERRGRVGVKSEDPLMVHPVKAFFEVIEPLAEKPKFFIDRKLAIMPLTGRSDNPGHALQRLGGLLSNIDNAFGPDPDQAGAGGGGEHGGAGGDDAEPMKDPGAGEVVDQDAAEADAHDLERMKNQREGRARGGVASGKSLLAQPRGDVTTMYVFVENSKGMGLFGPRCGAKCDWRNFSFGMYTTLVTKTHFLTWNSKTTASARIFGGDRELTPSEESYLSHPVCFKEGVVYQACHFDDCGDEDRGHDVFSLYRFRTPKVQEKLVRRLRACAGLTHLERVGGGPNAKKNPRVLYSYRAQNRGLQSRPYLVETLATIVEHRMNGTLIVQEMNGMSVLDLVALYSTLDIVVGPYGAGFYFGFMMPAGSVGIEINGWMLGGWTIETGTDRNPLQDYGSMFKASGGHHIVVSLPEYMAPLKLTAPRPHVPPARQISLSAKTLVAAMRAGYCALGVTGVQAQEGSEVTRCELGWSTVNKFQQEHLIDAGGTGLRRHIRSFYNPTIPEPLRHGLKKTPNSLTGQPTNAGGAMLSSAAATSLPHSRLRMLLQHSPLVAEALAWARTAPEVPNEHSSRILLGYHCPVSITKLNRKQQRAAGNSENAAEDAAELRELQKFMAMIETDVTFLRNYISFHVQVNVLTSCKLPWTEQTLGFNHMGQCNLNQQWTKMKKLKSLGKDVPASIQRCLAPHRMMILDEPLLGGCRGTEGLGPYDCPNPDSLTPLKGLHRKYKYLPVVETSAAEGDAAALKQEAEGQQLDENGERKKTNPPKLKGRAPLPLLSRMLRRDATVIVMPFPDASSPDVEETNDTPGEEGPTD